MRDMQWLSLACVLALGLALPALADTFTESWADQKAGDTVRQLKNWRPASSAPEKGVIVETDASKGEKALKLDSGSPKSGTFAAAAHPLRLAGAKKLTLKLDVTDDEGNNWFAAFLFPKSGAPASVYRYQINPGQQVVLARKDTAEFARASGVDAAGRHSYELTIDFADGANTVTASFDGNVIDTFTDDQSPFQPSDDAILVLSNFNDDGGVTLIHNVMIVIE